MTSSSPITKKDLEQLKQLKKKYPTATTSFQEAGREAFRAHQMGNVDQAKKIMEDWGKSRQGAALLYDLDLVNTSSSALSSLFAMLDEIKLGKTKMPLSLGMTLLSSAVSSYLSTVRTDKLVADLQRRFAEADRITNCPLVIDLDVRGKSNKGVQTLGTDARVYFDHDGDQFAERTGWIASGEAFVVRDLNGDGKINNGGELFGNHTLLKNGQRAVNGFIALAEYDLDGNHLIDIAEAQAAGIKLWRDENSNGMVDAGELLSFAQAGVKNLGTRYSEQTKTDAQDNSHRQLGSYTRSNGKTEEMVDVWFKTESVHTIETDLITLDRTHHADILVLPNCSGFGKVRSLHQAMVRDPVLKQQVQQFITQRDPGARATLLNDLIYRWVGVQDIDSGNRQYACLEKLLGQHLGSTRSFSVSAKKQLEQGYQQFTAWVNIQLLYQSTFQSLYQQLNFKWNPQIKAIEVDVDGLIRHLRTQYANDVAGSRVALYGFADDLKICGALGQKIFDILKAQGNLNGQGLVFDLAILDDHAARELVVWLDTQRLTQSIYQPLYQQLGYQWNASVQEIEADVGGLVQYLTTQYSSDAVASRAALQGFAASLKTRGAFGQKTLDRLAAQGNLNGQGLVFDLAVIHDSEAHELVAWLDTQRLTPSTFQALCQQLNYSWDASKKRLEVNVSGLVQYLQEQYATDIVGSRALLYQFADALSTIGWGYKTLNALSAHGYSFGGTLLEGLACDLAMLRGTKEREFLAWLNTQILDRSVYKPFCEQLRFFVFSSSHDLYFDVRALTQYLREQYARDATGSRTLLYSFLDALKTQGQYGHDVLHNLYPDAYGRGFPDVAIFFDNEACQFLSWVDTQVRDHDTLRSYYQHLNLKWNESELRIEADVGGLVQYLRDQYASDASASRTSLYQLAAELDEQGVFGQKTLETLRAQGDHNGQGLMSDLALLPDNRDIREARQFLSWADTQALNHDTLRSYYQHLNLKWNESERKIEVDVDGLIQYLRDQYASDASASRTLLYQLAAELKAQGALGQRILETLSAQGDLNERGLMLDLALLLSNRDMFSRGRNNIYDLTVDNSLFQTLFYHLGDAHDKVIMPLGNIDRKRYIVQIGHGIAATETEIQVFYNYRGDFSGKVKLVFNDSDSLFLKNYYADGELTIVFSDGTEWSWGTIWDLPYQRIDVDIFDDENDDTDGDFAIYHGDDIDGWSSRGWDMDSEYYPSGSVLSSDMSQMNIDQLLQATASFSSPAIEASSMPPPQSGNPLYLSTSNFS